MLALAVLATLPHSNGALDGLLGSASMIYSKFICASSGAQQDGVVGCASGGFTKWDALRLPPNTNLLIYGPSLVREIAQLLLHAEQSSPDASITLVSGDAAVDAGGAAVECFCGTTFVECSSCYDIATWELGQNRRLTSMINYRPLQIPSGLDDLNRWIGEQQFTLAAVMGPHVPKYFGVAAHGNWADQLWDVFSSHFEPMKLIHVSPWFGWAQPGPTSPAPNQGLVHWPPPGDEAGVKATTFNTTKELGSWCGAGEANRRQAPMKFLGNPCGHGDAVLPQCGHQCIFVCERSTGAAPSNCKATPFVHMTQQFVGLVRQCVANAETASADLIRRRDRGHYTHALEKGSDPVSQHG